MTTSRRISKALRGHKASRTTSNRAKLYMAIPPKEGWPAFNGSNWLAFGTRNKGK
jgi:hypothetical protein